MEYSKLQALLRRTPGNDPQNHPKSSNNQLQPTTSLQTHLKLERLFLPSKMERETEKKLGSNG